MIAQEVQENIADMHRRGLTAGNIAAITGIAESTIRAATGQPILPPPAPPLVRRERIKKKAIDKPEVPWINPENIGIEENWEVEGLCRTGGYNPDLWFASPTEINLMRLAQRVCYRCPVIVQCRSIALARGERNGIWGGLTETQRKKMRKLRKQEEAETI